MQNRALTIPFFALALVCVLLPPCSWAQAAPTDGNVVELTRVDLVRAPDWEHRRVSIDGFVLGMRRSEAFDIAGASKLRLRPNMPGLTASERKGPCRQASCSVSQVRGNWIGVDLYFDADRLTKIKVSVPVDADPEVKKVNVANKFKGLTYEFFNNYSDNLRERILGSNKGNETPITAGSQVSALVDVGYDYSHAGMVVHVTRDQRDHPPMPFDLEVDFIDPR
jgi:hypothetical protein